MAAVSKVSELKTWINLHTLDHTGLMWTRDYIPAKLQQGVERQIPWSQNLKCHTVIISKDLCLWVTSIVSTSWYSLPTKHICTVRTDRVEADKALCPVEIRIAHLGWLVGNESPMVPRVCMSTWDQLWVIDQVYCIGFRYGTENGWSHENLPGPVYIVCLLLSRKMDVFIGSVGWQLKTMKSRKSRCWTMCIAGAFINAQLHAATVAQTHRVKASTCANMRTRLSRGVLWEQT